MINFLHRLFNVPARNDIRMKRVASEYEVDIAPYEVLTTEEYTRVVSSLTSWYNYECRLLKISDPLLLPPESAVRNMMDVNLSNIHTHAARTFNESERHASIHRLISIHVTLVMSLGRRKHDALVSKFISEVADFNDGDVVSLVEEHPYMIWTPYLNVIYLHSICTNKKK